MPEISKFYGIIIYMYMSTTHRIFMYGMMTTKPR